MEIKSESQGSEKAVDNLGRMIESCLAQCLEYVIAFFIALVMATVSYFRGIRKGVIIPGWDVFIARSLASLGCGLLGYLAAVLWGTDEAEARMLWAALSALFADRILDLWEAIVVTKIEKISKKIGEDK